MTLRVRRGLASLRSRALFVVVRGALGRGREGSGFRLVHFSVQSNHLHLIVEAVNERALARGIQGLCVRIARAINRCVVRTGKVFADRYHARALATPRAVHFAVRYVLLNFRKHEPRARRARPGSIDACSSAPWFAGFSPCGDLVRARISSSCAREARADWLRTSGSVEPPVVSPHTWLLSVGLARAGPISIDDSPTQP